MRSGRRVGAFIVELYLEKCHIFFQAETCSTFIYFLTTMAYRLLCWTFPSKSLVKILLETQGYLKMTLGLLNTV